MFGIYPWSLTIVIPMLLQLTLNHYYILFIYILYIYLKMYLQRKISIMVVNRELASIYWVNHSQKNKQCKEAILLSLAPPFPLVSNSLFSFRLWSSVTSSAEASAGVGEKQPQGKCTEIWLLSCLEGSLLWNISNFLPSLYSWSALQKLVSGVMLGADHWSWWRIHLPLV